MIITIHRGAQTIGGSCVEIQSKGSRILLDVGTPLMQPGGGELNPTDLENPSIENGILPDIKGIYKDASPDVEAILISHSHMDHCGLLDHLHPDIPVYLSQGSHAMIQIGNVFYPPKNRIHFDNFKIVEHWKPFQVGPFKITSYLMDHSGFDACAFLIEAEGKKIFYSGDFRGHGRKSILLDKIVANPITDIDCLLMEGTTLGGNHQVGFNTEDEVEQAFSDAFCEQKDVCFVAASGSNIDRLVSLYNAARKNKKILVLDLYAFYVLYRLKELGAKLPPFDGDNIRIFYIRGHAQSIAERLDKTLLYKFKHRKIEIDEILKHRIQMVLKLPIGAMTKISNALVKDKSFQDVKLIYSMWQGYLEKDGRYENFCAQYNAELTHIHVSGHAYLDDLKRLAQALNPTQLVPVHTISKDIFSSCFNNTRLYDDSQPFEI